MNLLDGDGCARRQRTCRDGVDADAVLAACFPCQHLRVRAFEELWTIIPTACAFASGCLYTCRYVCVSRSKRISRRGHVTVRFMLLHILMCVYIYIRGKHGIYTNMCICIWMEYTCFICYTHKLNKCSHLDVLHRKKTETETSTKCTHLGVRLELSLGWRHTTTIAGHYTLRGKICERHRRGAGGHHGAYYDIMMVNTYVFCKCTFNTYKWSVFGGHCGAYHSITIMHMHVLFKCLLVLLLHTFTHIRRPALEKFANDGARRNEERERRTWASEIDRGCYVCVTL